VAYPLSTEKDRKNMLHIVAVMLNHCHFNRLCLFTRTGITEVEKSGVELVSPFYEVNMACFKILWLTIYIKIIWANMLEHFEKGNVHCIEGRLIRPHINYNFVHMSILKQYICSVAYGVWHGLTA